MINKIQMIYKKIVIYKIKKMISNINYIKKNNIKIFKKIKKI